MCTARFYGEERGDSGEASEAPKLQRMSKVVLDRLMSLNICSLFERTMVFQYVQFILDYQSCSSLQYARSPKNRKIYRRQYKVNHQCSKRNNLVNNLIKLRKYLFCDYGGGGGDPGF